LAATAAAAAAVDDDEVAIYIHWVYVVIGGEVLVCLFVCLESTTRR
jgi:hypothetical protein